MYGAMLCSGVFGLLIAKPFSTLIRFFPPLVAGHRHLRHRPVADRRGRQPHRRDNPAAKDDGQVSHIALAGLVMLIVAVSLAAGLLPAVAPTFYEHFPSNFQVIRIAAWRPRLSGREETPRHLPGNVSGTR